MKIPGQMTIFDFLKPTYQSINSITEEEAAGYIGEALGLEFSHKTLGDFEYWEAKKGPFKLGVKYDNFFPGINGGRRFIGCDIENKRIHAGGSAPLDTIDEAVAYFRKKMEEFK